MALTKDEQEELRLLELQVVSMEALPPTYSGGDDFSADLRSAGSSAPLEVAKVD